MPIPAFLTSRYELLTGLRRRPCRAWPASGQRAHRPRRACVTCALRSVSAHEPPTWATTPCARQSRIASTVWCSAPRSGVLIWTTSAAPAALKARMSSTVLAHSSATSCARPPSCARSAASARICASREPGVERVLDAQRERLGRLGHREDHLGVAPEQPVDVEVQDRRVVRAAAQVQDAVADPAHVVDDPGGQLRRVDQPVRERVDLLEDHLVDVVVARLAGLGVDRDARERARQVPLGRDHLGHRGPGAVRGRVEQRLADAVVGGGAVALDEHVAERGHRPSRAAGPPRGCGPRAPAASSRGSRPPTPLYCTLTQSPCAT